MRRRLRAVAIGTLAHRAFPIDETKTKTIVPRSIESRASALPRLNALAGTMLMKRTRRPPLCDFQLVSVPARRRKRSIRRMYFRIVSLFWDHGLQRQRRMRYQAYLSNADARQGQRDWKGLSG